MVWIDEEHLVVPQYHFCPNEIPAKRKGKVEIVVYDMAGQTKSMLTDSGGEIVGGQLGVLLARQGKDVRILDSELRMRQTLECPLASLRCWVYTATPGLSDSDFALCSVNKGEEDCAFYRGVPGEKMAEWTTDQTGFDGAPFNPYMLVPPATRPIRQAYKVGESEFWDFDNRLKILASVDAGGVSDVLSKQAWTGQYWCTGSVSGSEPRRFLEACNGADVYTDGELDSLFGYSRIVLFDVTSRKMLVQIKGRSGASAAMSPSGKVIAVLRRGKIRLYRVE
jgi:hypothetical protein